MAKGQATVFLLTFNYFLASAVPAQAQSVVEQMQTADVRNCAHQAFLLSEENTRLADNDRAMTAEGLGIRHESELINIARKSVQVRDPKAVQAFNARLAALSQRVSNYQQELSARNQKASAINLHSADYEIQCVGRPYDPALLNGIPAAEVAAFTKGSHPVAIPQVVRAGDAKPEPVGAETRSAPPPIGTPPSNADNPDSPFRHYFNSSFRSFDGAVAAADRGDAEGQYEVGIAYLYGIDVARDDVAARALLLKAGEQKHAGALFGLSTMFSEGRGGGVDEARGHAFLVQSAELGYSEAEHNLALWYAERGDDDRHHRSALEWMERAANQGDPESEFVAAEFYERGFSGQPDDAHALSWLRKSALQGVREAELALGVRYERGSGVERDRVEALKWYLLSANPDKSDPTRQCARLLLSNSDTGEKAKASIARLEEKMPPEEVDRALALARSWQSVSNARRVGGC